MSRQSRSSVRRLDRGMNLLDNSWDYNQGVSEIRVGKVLKDGDRQKAFVMTKIDGPDERRGEAPDQGINGPARC